MLKQQMPMSHQWFCANNICDENIHANRKRYRSNETETINKQWHLSVIKAIIWHYFSQTVQYGWEQITHQHWEKIEWILRWANSPIGIEYFPFQSTHALWINMDWLRLSEPIFFYIMWKNGKEIHFFGGWKIKNGFFRHISCWISLQLSQIMAFHQFRNFHRF